MINKDLLYGAIKNTVNCYIPMQDAKNNKKKNFAAFKSKDSVSCSSYSTTTTASL